MCWVQLISVHKFGTVATSGTFATFATFVTFSIFPTAKVYISYLAALVYWFTGLLTCPISQVLVLTIQVILCWVQFLLMLNLLLLLLIIIRPYHTIPDQTGHDQTRPVLASPVLVSPAAPFIMSPQQGLDQLHMVFGALHILLSTLVFWRSVKHGWLHKNTADHSWLQLLQWISTAGSSFLRSTYPI